MSGKLFGLGVGPGDAELLTLKALRLIKESEVIAVPGNDTENSVAYQIAKSVYGGLDEKILLPVAMPMTKDAAVLEENHKKAADDVEVLPGTELDAVLINLAVQAVDAVEKIYMTVEVS